MTFIKTDIFDPHKREILSTKTYPTLIEFLLSHYPNGFDTPMDISVNGEIVEVDNYDMPLSDDCIIVFADKTALPVGLIGGWLVTALANIAISMAISYVINRLFSPKESQSQSASTTSYNFGGNQNQQAFGALIPCVYGRVNMYPSLIAQPHYYYVNNVEYVNYMMCLGHGRVAVREDELRLNDDLAPVGDVSFKTLYQEDFKDIAGSAYGSYIIKEHDVYKDYKLVPLEDNIITLETEELYGEVIERIEVDFVAPSGVFSVSSRGGYKSRQVKININVRILNPSENIGEFDEVYNQDYSVVFTGVSSNILQQTVMLPITSGQPKGQLYEMTITRSTSAGSTSVVDDVYIKRIKNIYKGNDVTSTYGNITLLATNMKVSEAISAKGQFSINVFATRTDVINTLSSVLTDIYTNTTYGGALDAGDLDFPSTVELVNCVMEESLTLMDAMRKIAQPQSYSVFTAGMDVVLKKDSPTNVVTSLYNENNILKNTIKTQYFFDEEYAEYDGIEGTYIEGNTWTPSSVLYPESSIRPKKIDLFGVVVYDEPTVFGFQFVDDYLAYSLSNGENITLLNRAYDGASGSRPGSFVSVYKKDGRVIAFTVRDNDLFMYDATDPLNILDYTPPKPISFGHLVLKDVRGEHAISNSLKNNPRLTNIITGDILFQYLEDTSPPPAPVPINWEYTLWFESLYVMTITVSENVILAISPEIMNIIVFVNGVPIPSLSFINNPDYNSVENRYYKKANRYVVDYALVGDIIYLLWGDGTTNVTMFNAYQPGNGRANGEIGGLKTVYGIINAESTCIVANTDYFFIGVGVIVLVYSVDTFERISSIALPGLAHGLIRSIKIYGHLIYVVLDYDIYTLSMTEGELAIIDRESQNGYTINYVDVLDDIIYTPSQYLSLYKTDKIDVAEPECLAKYLYNQDKKRRKSITFKTDVQGLIPQYMDKIQVSHNSLTWGESGTVVARDNSVVTLSNNLEDTTGGKSIIFRNIDSTVSDPLEVTIDNENTVTTEELPPAWVDNAIFYTVYPTDFKQEFIVTSTKQSSEYEWEIEAIKYEEEIYC